jgi:hypothetical protein
VEWFYFRFGEQSGSILDYENVVKSFYFCLGPPQREMEKWNYSITPYFERSYPNLESLRSYSSISPLAKHTTERLHSTSHSNQTDS